MSYSALNGNNQPENSAKVQHVRFQVEKADIKVPILSHSNNDLGKLNIILLTVFSFRVE